ncbi:MAG: hypothetical protein RQ741_08735 [Wenzhouxiangellaceae bacterium]|nr:hypothetical protein [Wenzhouxiangellaceae bacterium]
MYGDRMLIEPHCRKAAAGIDAWLQRAGLPGSQRMVVTVAGEPGAGKSEISAALANVLAQRDVDSVIFQQADYFVYPPKRNDRARREDLQWVGPREVRLSLMDEQLQSFRDGAGGLKKPLMRAAPDLIDEERIDEEVIDLFGFKVAIAVGSYTSLLESADVRVFVDRSDDQVRARRQKRLRESSGPDALAERIYEIEHRIISAHRTLADLIVESDYSVISADPK